MAYKIPIKKLDYNKNILLVIFMTFFIFILLINISNISAPMSSAPAVAILSSHHIPITPTTTFRVDIIPNEWNGISFAGINYTIPENISNFSFDLTIPSGTYDFYFWFQNATFFNKSDTFSYSLSAYGELDPTVKIIDSMGSGLGIFLQIVAVPLFVLFLIIIFITMVLIIISSLKDFFKNFKINKLNLI